MKFTLEEIEKGGKIKPPKKKKKKPRYTDIPTEEYPYNVKNFSHFVDIYYEDEGE